MLGAKHSDIRRYREHLQRRSAPVSRGQRGAISLTQWTRSQHDHEHEASFRFDPTLGRARPYGPGAAGRRRAWCVSGGVPTRPCAREAEAEGTVMPEDVFVAKNVRANVRELEGALRKVLAYSRFSHKDINIQLARGAWHEARLGGRRLDRRDQRGAHRGQSGEAPRAALRRVLAKSLAAFSARAAGRLRGQRAR
jgi:Bacterial dnaA  protein